jgi:hypothetical protein
LALRSAAVKLFRDAPQKDFLPQFWQDVDHRSPIGRLIVKSSFDFPA